MNRFSTSIPLVGLVACGRAVPGPGFMDEPGADGGTGDGAGDGDGGIDAPPWVTCTCTSTGFPSVAWPTTGATPTSAVVGDFNADGHADSSSVLLQSCVQ